MKAVVIASLAEPGRKQLEAALEVVYAGWAVSEPVLTPLPSDDEIIALAKDARAIIVPGELSAAAIEACPDLKVIGVARGDPRGVALEAATARGISVVYAAGRNAIAVAELTMGFVIMLFRQLPQAHSFVGDKHWRTWDDLFATSLISGRELAGRTMGLVGFGFVGQEVARRARAFGLHLLIYDPYVSREAIAAAGAKKTDLPALLSNSDVVSLHCKVTDETRGLIGAAELALMRPDSYFINTARAAIVDETALREALTSGHLAGAALDVYWGEPLRTDSEFLNMPNVIHTPHIGSGTVDVEPRTAAIVVDDVLAVLRGEKPAFLANPQVLS